jgi:hypothetical protein
MKKIKQISVLMIILVFGATNACKDDFLDITPNGALDGSVLATPEGIDALLIGAYSMMDGLSSQGTGGWEAASSNWVFGSIRGLEANKGSDAGDQPDINALQTYTESATNPYLNLKWRSIYEGISRCNAVMLVTADAEEAGAVTADQAANFRRQARALRGHFHFEAWRMWQMIPYVDEATDHTTLTNSEDVRARIIADLTEGTALPVDMDQIGRFNKTVSQVLLAKALMQMNNDAAAYNAAKALLLDVVATGKKPDNTAIGLEPMYGDIFDVSKRNASPEAIYTVQYSVNDGSGGWNAGQGEVLNFPYKSGGSPGGCCGFFQPSQDLVNSFRTSGGLPLLDNSYNSQPVLNDQGKTPTDATYVEDPGPLDPRLDWTAGRRGIPYLDWGPHTGSDWVRDQSYAGPYSPKKQVYRKSQEGTFTEVGNWTSGWTANGYRLIRYADVLLLLAECQIETSDLAGARTNINLVRARAANVAGFVKNDDGSNAANYVISQYPAGAPFDSQANARIALRMERKLELGMEGHRYFDLQRWGAVVAELNRVLTYEKSVRSAMYGSASIGAEDVNFPVPQEQIDLSVGKLTQNR